MSRAFGILDCWLGFNKRIFRSEGILFLNNAFIQGKWLKFLMAYFLIEYFWYI